MREREWAVLIDRHDETGRKVDSAELRVMAASTEAARQRATQQLVDRYDCDWSVTMVRPS